MNEKGEPTITIMYRTDGGETVLTFFPATDRIVSTTSGDLASSAVVRLSRFRSKILTGLLFGIAAGVVKILKGEVDQERDIQPGARPEWPEIFKEPAGWPDTIERGEIS